MSRAPSPELAAFIRTATTRHPEIEEINLFGSRARGDARPDSDWDVVLLLDNDADEAAERRLT